MQIPPWLESLVEIVAGSSEAHAPPFKMGYRWGVDDGLWEVLMYPIPVQIVGGDDDGAIISPGFSTDLQQVRSAFDQIEAEHWSVHDHLEGPEIQISGVCQGHEVYLRMLVEAPGDEEPGLYLEVSETADMAVN